MRVAVVHDFMAVKAGGENCVAEFLRIYPQADLFVMVDFIEERDRAFLDGHKITTSFIQRLPFARKHYRTYLPLMPIAVEQFDMTGYDLVISTSAAMAKGVITGPGQLHISYVFSPIRYAWDLQQVYLRESGLSRGIKGLLARVILHYLRLWDTRTAHGVDHFIAISDFIRQRIWKVYRRDSAVIYPPVDLERFTPGAIKDDFYVTASRMVPYKCMPMIVEAFRAMPDRQLVVIGDGPDMVAVRKAAGTNVTVLGRQPNEVLVDHLRRAKAFIFAAEEDFGIAPLEAQACGTPVIAFGRGAAVETIRGGEGQGRTGMFFAEQTAASLAEAVHAFDGILPGIDPAACRANAERFSVERFRRDVRTFIKAAQAQAQAREHLPGYGETESGTLPCEQPALR